jgi:hypothetical protein
MKRMIEGSITLFLIILHTNLFGQTLQEFDLQRYKTFLSEQRNLTFTGIREMHPSAEYLAAAPTDFDIALYADSIKRYYALNETETELLEAHSFMVSDRIRYVSFGEAFYTIYKRDLPVYISSDAIMHALHISYSEILSTLELHSLLPRLTDLLEGLHGAIPVLADSYVDMPEMQIPLMDADLYLTIPLLLLGIPAEPYFDGNTQPVRDLMELIASETAASYPLFAPAEVPRTIDFSQFSPRGHYTQSEELTRYFKAMMWLGRTEFYLIVPNAFPYGSMTEEERDEIGRRQTTAAYLIYEALQHDNNRQTLDEINELITFLVGESDNVTADHLGYMLQQNGIVDAASFTDMENYRLFKNALEAEPFAQQRILSQILQTDPMSPDDIQPASAFLLLGQRFIIDSFVMGNLVYDKVKNPNRMLPKSADVLFALGNNDALAVLEEELNFYNYAPNLAALRYLVDMYEPEYWNMSFFNLWLQAIRQLNPPADRSPLPSFMQTEPWTHKTMTTQLASWAQLRHDNLLYGKQSYSGGPICSYPQSYVEPVPHFFGAIENLAVLAKDSFDRIEVIEPWIKSWIVGYFEGLAEIASRLKVIAQKQIDGIDTNEEEKSFLREMLHESQMCGPEFDGWYADLFFTGDQGALKQDYIIADVHTSPFDEFGNPVGWVMHVGTGPVNLAVLAAELGDGKTYAFVGPVMSYYEHVSVNFKRFTDEEWITAFESDGSMRPDFVNSYLSTAGEPYYDHRFYFISSVDDHPNEIADRITLAQNYPNPFNAGTLITFKIPSGIEENWVKLSVYNIQGQLIETLIDRPMPAGNYSVRWDGNSASGTYFYRLQVDGQVVTGRMILLK